jgi:hypothetical protein
LNPHIDHSDSHSHSPAGASPSGCSTAFAIPLWFSVGHEVVGWTNMQQNFLPPPSTPTILRAFRPQVGVTLLHAASFHGADDATIDELVRRGANVDAATSTVSYATHASPSRPHSLAIPRRPRLPRLRQRARITCGSHMCRRRHLARAQGPCNVRNRPQRAPRQITPCRTSTTERAIRADAAVCAQLLSVA